MAGKMVEKKIRSALPLYIAAGAFLVCAAVLPVYSLPGFLGACAVAAGAYFLSDKKIPPRVVMVPAPDAAKFSTYFSGSEIIRCTSQCRSNS